MDKKTYKNKYEYNSYSAMKARCYAKYNHKQYKDYGGRGITPCQAIADSFSYFVSIVGERPLGYSLDRINNYDGYNCGECKYCKHNNKKCNIRWADRKSQNCNKRIIHNCNIYKQYNRWHVAIRKDGGLKYYGSFCSLEDAIVKRDLIRKVG